jgi:hypothetical protein
MPVKLRRLITYRTLLARSARVISATESADPVFPSARGREMMQERASIRADDSGDERDREGESIKGAPREYIIP